MKKANSFLKIFFLFSVISISQIFAQSDPVYVKLTGTNFYETGNGDGIKAFDGDIATYLDASNSNTFVGINLGVLTKVTKLRFYPRPGWASRMTGGKFQGSNDNVIFTTFYTISPEPTSSAWTEVLIDADYQYVRYYSPANGYCNVSEIEFWTTQGAVPSIVNVQSVSIENPTYTLKVAEIVQVNNTISPSNATNKKFTYTITPSELASIDNVTGILTGLSVGTGTITVTTEDGAKTATSSLTINAATELKLTGNQFDNNYQGGAAFDGNTSSFVETGAADAYTGLDFGSVKNISKIKFFPRSGFTTRMTGGKFQGSNNNTDYTDIYTISSEPANGWSEVLVTASYQYVRYLGPSMGFLNVAEIEFWTPVSDVSTGLTDQNLNKSVIYANSLNEKLVLSVIADKIILFGIDGREVLVSKGSEFDISSLTKGIYIIKYFVGENIGTLKIIKQ